MVSFFIMESWVVLVEPDDSVLPSSVVVLAPGRPVVVNLLNIRKN